MIRISPKRKLGWSFDIERADVIVGSLDLARVRRGGSIRIGEQQFALKPERFFGPMSLRADGRVIARARRTASFTPRYRIEADDRLLELRGGLLFRDAVLAHGDVVVATLRRPHFFRRILDIELLQNAPLPLVVFASAVIILYWRAASRSSASG